MNLQLNQMFLTNVLFCTGELIITHNAEISELERLLIDCTIFTTLTNHFFCFYFLSSQEMPKIIWTLYFTTIVDDPGLGVGSKVIISNQGEEL